MIYKYEYAIHNVAKLQKGDILLRKRTKVVAKNTTIVVVPTYRSVEVGICGGKDHISEGSYKDYIYEGKEIENWETASEAMSQGLACEVEYEEKIIFGV